jgi:glycosyltransferase involved in cell wall biosynthesis
MTKRVSIGLPTYNRPDLLHAALASLTAQTHRELEIIVSDNASPGPQVRELVAALAQRDPRIRYLRHATNQGAAANFKSVLTAATAPYFMWAGDDDLWEPTFVAHCLGLLAANPDAQMAFGGIDNINTGGDTIRTYPGFSRFTSTGDRARDIALFIADPDVLGKPNLIYGLYRREALAAVVAECWDTAQFASYGGDMVLVFAFVCRHPIVASDEVLVHKRVLTASMEAPVTRDPETILPPPGELVSFVRRHLAVTPDSATRAITARAFRQRLVRQTARAAGSAAFWQAAASAGGRRLARLAGRN